VPSAASIHAGETASTATAIHCILITASRD
jgi:hypothetical protein